METTEAHLHRVVDHHHQEVEVPVEEIQAAEVPVEVAHRHQEVRQPKHVSTTKTKMAIGATRHRQKDGALDYFEGCDSLLFILILFAQLFVFFASLE